MTPNPGDVRAYPDGMVKRYILGFRKVEDAQACLATMRKSFTVELGRSDVSTLINSNGSMIFIEPVGGSFWIAHVCSPIKEVITA